MAVRQLPAGRWICYYKKDGQGKREYFGRGDSGEAAAILNEIMQNGEG